MNIKSRIRACFNKAKLTYEQYGEIHHLLTVLALNKLKRFQTEFSSIVDLACGTGISTEHVVKMLTFKQCYAVDFSNHLLEKVAQKIQKPLVIPILQDFDGLNIPDHYINLIFCNMGLQWSPSLISTLCHLHQTLTPQGYLVFSMPIQGNFPEITSEFKNQHHSHQQVLSIINQSGYILRDFEKILYKKNFQNQQDILASIKGMGATCLTKNIKHSLQKKPDSNIFKSAHNKQLSYKIGIYVCQKI